MRPMFYGSENSPSNLERSNSFENIPIDDSNSAAYPTRQISPENESSIVSTRIQDETTPHRTQQTTSSPVFRAHRQNAMIPKDIKSLEEYEKVSSPVLR